MNMNLRDRWRAKRKLLKSEIASRLRPRLLELGFQSTRTREGAEAWPGLARRGYDYARRREGRIETVTLYWDKWGRPWFLIFFAVRREDDPASLGGVIGGEVRSAYYSGLAGLTGVKQRWFGRGQEPALAVALAVSGVDALDRFLRTGASSDHVEITQVGSQSVRGPIDNGDILASIVLFPFALLRMFPRNRVSDVSRPSD